MFNSILFVKYKLLQCTINLSKKYVHSTPPKYSIVYLAWAAKINFEKKEK